MDPSRKAVLLKSSMPDDFQSLDGEWESSDGYDKIIKCTTIPDEGFAEKTLEVLDMRSLDHSLVILDGYLCITGEARCSCGNPRCYLGSKKCLTHMQNPNAPNGSLCLPFRRGQHLLEISPDTLSPRRFQTKSTYLGNYKGEYQNGSFHGRGVYEWINGDKYEGQWERGRPHGKGKLFFASGSKYRGEFRNGKRNGLGELSDRYGIYEGEWQDDSRHGRGTQTRLNGQILDGEWRCGEFIGRHGDQSGQVESAAAADADAAPDTANRETARAILAVADAPGWSDGDRRNICPWYNFGRCFTFVTPMFLYLRV